MRTTTPPIAPTLSDPADHAIRVRVVPAFAAEHSDASANRYVFTYTITIDNGGDEAVQLVARHWAVIDADGKREDVRGPGVVGKQPRLEPGRPFEYQSFCPLKTHWGTMEGEYRMRRDDGEEFDVSIPRFVLHAD